MHEHPALQSVAVCPMLASDARAIDWDHRLAGAGLEKLSTPLELRLAQFGLSQPCNDTTDVVCLRMHRVPTRSASSCILPAAAHL